MSLDAGHPADQSRLAKMTDRGRDPGLIHRTHHALGNTCARALDVRRGPIASAVLRTCVAAAGLDVADPPMFTGDRETAACTDCMAGGD
jgi:hypothetical protein